MSIESSVVVTDADGETTWTFAGQPANAGIAPILSQTTESKVNFDTFVLRFEPHVSSECIRRAIDVLKTVNDAALIPNIEEPALDALKFSECIPRELAFDTIREQIVDTNAILELFDQKVRFVQLSP